MPKASVTRRGTRDPDSRRPSRAGSTCKTCTSCRQKKVKCDGSRPRCHDCEANDLSCAYPRDARREMRPSSARVQGLEATVALMAERMRASGIVIPNVSGSDYADRDAASEWFEHNQEISLEPRQETRVGEPHGGTILTPTSLIAGRPENSNHMHLGSTGLESAANPGMNEGETYESREDSYEDSYQPPGDNSTSLWPGAAPLGRVTDEHHGQDQARVEASSAVELDENIDKGLSPCEARVAGVFHEQGRVSSVHGLAGIMNPTGRKQHQADIAKITRKGSAAIAESKARLISNAVLQRQRETQLFRQPTTLMDLDGCDPETAKHLLDLHFNRQHYAYLITYRPAIMDSVANGGGPWSNKLLLNAIYFSSTLYSARPSLRSNPNDLRTAGARFYQRIKQLLVDVLDEPSVPSAAGLLLTGAALTAQGRSSAGWNLCGIAYRMILDLGCHMTLPTDYQSPSGQSQGLNLHRDLEQEMRRRLYWGAYMTDATQALYLGRPCMFASVEARVPLQLLDTFEELEDWQPYVDALCPDVTQPYYVPHSAHAVSTFKALGRLLQISTQITELYGIQSIRLSSEVLLQRKRTIEEQLEKWSMSLPEHLSRDPDESPTPPPHLITPQ